MPAVADESRYDEQLEVRRRRFDEAYAAGLSYLEAEIFADNGEDIGLLRQLVAAGCTAELVARIVI